MLQKNYYKLKIIVFTGISKSFFFYTGIELILWVQFQKPDTILYLQHFFILRYLDIFLKRKLYNISRIINIQILKIIILPVIKIEKLKLIFFDEIFLLDIDKINLFAF